MTDNVVETPYSFRGEPVHIMNLKATTTEWFECRRCHRLLHQDRFTLLKGVRVANKRPSPYRLLVALHPHCQKCQADARGQWNTHPDYDPNLDRFFQALYAHMRSAARPRGILVGVSKDDLLGLWFKQNGCCALTGMQMNWNAPKGKGRRSKALTTPSVDRINSEGNYVCDNIQLVAAIVNVMKSDLPDSTFVDLCRMVSEHALTKALTIPY